MNEAIEFFGKDDLLNELREIHHRYSVLNLEAEDEDPHASSHLSTLNVLIDMTEKAE